MKLVGKLFVISGVAGAAAAVATYLARTLRADRTTAGSMNVGAVDEVELSGPMRIDQDPSSHEPEGIPSEHSEINDLRRKMPFG